MSENELAERKNKLLYWYAIILTATVVGLVAATFVYKPLSTPLKIPILTIGIIALATISYGYMVNRKLTKTEQSKKTEIK